MKMIQAAKTQKRDESPLSQKTERKSKLSLLSKTPDILNISRLATNRLSQNSLLMIKELNRIEEEYDLKVFSKTANYQDFNDEPLKKEAVKVSECFLEDIIFCIQFFDKRIGRVLGKGWKSYLKAVNKGVSKKEEEVVQEIKVKQELRSKNIGVQCDNIEPVVHEEDYVKYIDTIRSALFRIDMMNHKKLVDELQKLLFYISPKLDLNFSDSDYETEDKKEKLSDVKDQKMKSRLILKQETSYLNRALPKSTLSRNTQTDLAPKDAVSAETLKILLNERDKVIYQLRENLGRYKNLEMVWKKKELDFKITQGLLKEIEENGCAKCKERMERLRTEINENSELKKHLQNTQKIEIELDSAKIMLQESSQIITKNHEKITELSENLEEMQNKIREIRKERKKLEERLEKESKLRNTVEKKLNDLEKLRKPSPLISNFNSAKLKQESLLDGGRYAKDNLNSSAIEKSFHTPSNNLDFSGFGDRSSFLGSSATPERDYFNRSTFLDRPKSKIIREKLTEMITPKQKIALNSRQVKNNNILNLLKISKEEYMLFSKQARIELFEILFEHKDKCGQECEHLKKAYMIKEKEKGKLYPIKKYTIQAV